MDIKFEPIDVDVNFSRCLAFRRDAHFCSFNTYVGYEASINGYETQMRQRINESNWHYIHMLCGNEIIGQLEFRSFSDLPEMGYVHLVYIVPKYRGLGIAGLAQSFIIQTLISNGCKSAMLLVSRTNKRAINHYKRFGWEYVKPNAKDDITDFYKCQFCL
ncbi:GNAT family N-acetyltransferase [Marinomonas sp. 2405UD68-3]|uniref:GNAT family N-acetyltransferase n=1 Tax=Marinomonas sp. 2405UD68-3 TaxID=3391835 RepID=UPI0039C9B0E3